MPNLKDKFYGFTLRHCLCLGVYTNSITVTVTHMKEGTVLSNDTRNTFYLRLLGVIHKDHIDRERGNLFRHYMD